jgi:hypothetical protein
MCMRVAVPAVAGVRGVNPLGTSARTRFSRGGALRGSAAACADIGVPGKLGRGGHSRAGCPGPTGFSAPGTVAPARGRCAPGTAHGRTPLAAGCRGDAGEERSRAQVPGSGMLVRKAAPGQPRVTRAAGVSRSRRCLARRRQECSDQRRPTAAAYAPGRRTTGTGVLGRTPDARTRTRTYAQRAGAAGHQCRRPVGSRSATVRRASDLPSRAAPLAWPMAVGPPRMPSRPSWSRDLVIL